MSFMSRGSDSSTSRPSEEAESFERDEWKRRSRNLSEKKRRDHFNTLINQLSAMVTTSFTSSPNKMDKSAVLKATIAFLKSNKVSSGAGADDSAKKWKPPFLSNQEFTYLMLEALDGFILLVSNGGKILYTSDGITALLGHYPVDVLEKGIYELVLPEERTGLYNFLQEGSHNSEDSSIEVNLRSENVEEGRVEYQPIRLTGYFKPWNLPRYAGDGESNAGVCIRGSNIFVCIARLIHAPFLRQICVPLSTRTEFSSRHSLEWKFLFLDHRAPPIIGYLPFELLGTSAYDYVHPQDTITLAKEHRSLMEKGEGTSLSYRFLTKGQQWIWIQTRFFITYHQWNSKPEFIVASHHVLSSGCTRNLSGSVPESENSKCYSEPKTGMTMVNTDSMSTSTTIAESVKLEVESPKKIPAQVHERLLIKQAELQQRILNEQDELRRVSSEILTHHAHSN